MKRSGVWLALATLALAIVSEVPVGAGEPAATADAMITARFNESGIQGLAVIAQRGSHIYYNENELGLGRELGCSTFTVCKLVGSRAACGETTEPGDRVFSLTLPIDDDGNSFAIGKDQPTENGNSWKETRTMRLRAAGQANAICVKTRRFGMGPHPRMGAYAVINAAGHHGLMIWGPNDQNSDWLFTTTLSGLTAGHAYRLAGFPETCNESPGAFTFRIRVTDVGSTAYIRRSIAFTAQQLADTRSTRVRDVTAMAPWACAKAIHMNQGNQPPTDAAR